MLCLWRAGYDGENAALVYGMDLFVGDGRGRWSREQEEHIEYAHEPAELLRLLEQAGFGDVRLDTDGPQGDRGRIFIEAVRL